MTANFAANLLFIAAGLIVAGGLFIGGRYAWKKWGKAKINPREW